MCAMRQQCVISGVEHTLWVTSGHLGSPSLPRQCRAAQHVEDPQVVLAEQLVGLARPTEVRDKILPGMRPFLSMGRW